MSQKNDSEQQATPIKNRVSFPLQRLVMQMYPNYALLEKEYYEAVRKYGEEKIKKAKELARTTPHSLYFWLEKL